MRRALITATILACVLHVLPAAAQNSLRHAKALPVAKDLAAAASEARDKRIPVLLAFTTRVCPYCRVARRDHLEPMHASEKWRGKSIMLEVQLDTPDALIDFDGKTTDVRTFARRFNVRSVPTIIVFDADGKPASTPVVGLLGADFYSAYIEQAMEAGLLKMRPASSQ